MNYLNYIWIPPLIISCIISAYAAKLSNNNVPYGSLYVFLASLVGIFIWLWVTKISKNILFDSIIYDIILTTVFTATFIFLKCGDTFNIYNWIGIALALLGLVLMKI